MSDGDKASKHASELSKLGAAKGGLARAAALTKDERREIARAAAEKRWGKKPDDGIPRATHAGPLRIGTIEFDCAVLANGKRVVSETKFMAAMGMYRSGALSTRRKEEEGSAPIPLFLAHKNLKPFAEQHLGGVHFEPLQYRNTEGSLVPGGIDALMIPKICEVWIDADRAGVLGPRQKVTAANADMLLRGFAQVGIIALVDEATGYQADRARDELQKILDAYIAEELRPWMKRFPDEFFRQLYRLHGWEFKPGTLRGPRYVGKLINKLVYEPLPPGVKGGLDQKNPPDARWQRRYKQHQFLTEDIGEPHLNKQIIEVIALMRASDDKEMFFRLFTRAFPKPGRQLALPFPKDEEENGEDSDGLA